MTEIEKKIKAKIPGEDTGIEIRRTMCDICTPLCHCGLDAYVKDGQVIKVEGTKGHPMNDGVLCTKGANNRAYIYRKDRIQTPLKRIGTRGEGKFEPVSWDEAYDIIAQNLLKTKQEYGANAVAFYSGYSKWYRFLLQRFAFAFGSVNYGSESSTCFTAGRMAWMTMTGKFARPDLQNAGLYVGWCSATHYSRFNNANNFDRFKRRGGKIIIVDPRITPAAQRIADLHLRVKPGTDGLLANCIAGLIIKNGWHDKDYISKYVHGFDRYADHVCSLDIDEVSRITTVSAADIQKAAEMIGCTKPTAIENALGSVIHHINGFQAARAVFALSAITGNYDRPGGNIPLDFSFCEQGAGYHTSDEEFAVELMPEGFEKRIGAEKYPLWAKLITQIQATELPQQILTGSPYPVRAVFACGMNYRIFSEPEYTKKAIESLDFFVDIDLFLTDTAKMADIVLPACSSFEREEFKAYPGGFGAYYTPAIEPLFESRSDARILQDLAVRMDLPDEHLKAGYRHCIEHVLQGSGLEIDEMLKSDLPIKSKAMRPFVPGAYINGGCSTKSGKLELYSELIAELSDESETLNPLPEYTPITPVPTAEHPLQLLTGVRIPNAIHSRLHSVPWARALRPEPMADISIEDATALGLNHGDPIRVYSPFGEIFVKANPTEMVSPGQVYMFHGYPEADVSSLLSHEHADPYSGFPGYTSGICNIEKQ